MRAANMEDPVGTNAKQGLEAFRIAGLPSDFYYIPNFLRVEEEASILQKVRNNPLSPFLTLTKYVLYCVFPS
jgi:hypothetical protein